MALETVFAMKATMKIMEFVCLEHHVPHTVAKILLVYVCVILAIHCMDKFVQDALKDKYGSQTKTDVLLLVELMRFTPMLINHAFVRKVTAS